MLLKKKKEEKNTLGSVARLWHTLISYQGAVHRPQTAAECLAQL